MLGFLLLPIRGVLAVAEIIHEHAMKELNDPEVIRKQLVELRLRFEMGEIDEPEYMSTEAELVARLRKIRLARLAEQGGNAR